MNGKKAKKKPAMCKTTNNDPQEVVSMTMDDKLPVSKHANEAKQYPLLVTLAISVLLVSIMFLVSRLEDRSPPPTPLASSPKETPVALASLADGSSAREISIPDIPAIPTPAFSKTSEIPVPDVSSKSTKAGGIRWTDIQHHIRDLPTAKILVDFGIFVLFRAVGWPAMKAIGAWLRRLPILEKLSPTNLKILTQSATRIWKTMVLVYSRTAASKFVNRGKKLLYPFLHPENHGHDDKHHHH